MAPVLSVTVTNYNYASFLPQNVESILGQSFGDFELILRCVDHLLSTDGVARLAEHSFELAADVLESDPIAQSLLAFAAHEVPAAGQTMEMTPTQLLKELTVLADDSARARSWPR